MCMILSRHSRAAERPGEANAFEVKLRPHVYYHTDQSKEEEEEEERSSNNSSQEVMEVVEVMVVKAPDQEL